MEEHTQKCRYAALGVQSDIEVTRSIESIILLGFPCGLLGAKLWEVQQCCKLLTSPGTKHFLLQAIEVVLASFTGPRRGP